MKSLFHKLALKNHFGTHIPLLGRADFPRTVLFPLFDVKLFCARCLKQMGKGKGKCRTKHKKDQRVVAKGGRRDQYKIS